ncbi:hypothetical protein LZ30DRAFT_700268 [Colletotrichum cereale]|nr:hypothetical protein LZ30DRAFT_700268 [Colletotrichum cereale]
MHARRASHTRVFVRVQGPAGGLLLLLLLLRTVHVRTGSWTWHDDRCGVIFATKNKISDRLKQPRGEGRVKTTDEKRGG